VTYHMMCWWTHRGARAPDPARRAEPPGASRRLVPARRPAWPPGSRRSCRPGSRSGWRSPRRSCALRAPSTKPRSARHPRSSTPLSRRHVRGLSRWPALSCS
jgi:hypothetical protein